MPGLLRGMARVAVVSGTATAVSNNVSRRQANRYAQEDAANAPAPETAGSNTDDQFAQLKQLGELKEQGVLTQAEFDAKKAQILGM